MVNMDTNQHDAHQLFQENKQSNMDFNVALISCVTETNVNMNKRRGGQVASFWARDGQAVPGKYRGLEWDCRVSKQKPTFKR